MTATVRVDAATFVRAREQVLRAVSRDEDAPAVVRCVLFEVDPTGGGGLRLVATDKARLAVSDVPAVAAVEGGHVTALVAAAALEGVVVDGEAGEVTIAVSAAGVSFAAGAGPGDGDGDGAPVEVAAEPGEFPDYAKFLAADARAQVLIVERDTLVSAIEDLPDDEPMQVRFGDDRLELGDVVPVVLPASYDGEVVRLFLDPTFLHDAAVSARGPQLAIEVSDPVSPVVVRGIDDGSFTTLVMPMRSGPSRAGRAT